MPTPFQESVWSLLTQIPKGKVTTYSELARALGKPRSVRAVGTAVGKNPNAPEVPCHRVLPVSGRIGNYSGPGGTLTKVRLLEEEGLSIVGERVLELESHLHVF